MLAIRWLTAVGAELAKKAIEEIRTITAPFRERALVLERDPNRVPLPGFGWADHIRAKELASILRMSRSKSVYQISREKLPRHQDEGGTYYLASEVEAYLLTQREEHLWTLNRKDGTYQKLSETLLIAPRFFFRPYNGINPLLIEPVDYGHIQNFLTSSTQDRSSAFERFAIREDDGSYCIPATLSRAQRAHARLSWTERLARNARSPGRARPTITLFGVPDAFAAFLGLHTS